MKNGKHYIGSTNNVERRFNEHQRGKVASTKHNRPLQLLFYKRFITKEEAHTKELWLKKQKSKKMIEDFMAL
ncbi:MAG: GIY-YIG nuclease family protein [Candidatus Absconditabacterales bacterium]